MFFMHVLKPHGYDASKFSFVDHEKVFNFVSNPQQSQPKCAKVKKCYILLFKKLGVSSIKMLYVKALYYHT